eukprot:NODE_12_length_54577_cov_0.384100.p18 type:complete len:306 gc:universal NODE_12_length_54577_cov_0.384100:4166-5083(+)
MLLSRYLWVWTTDEIVGNVAKTKQLVNTCAQNNIKDVFLYINPNSYGYMTDGLKLLISNLNRANVKSWGMDGRRSYFSDSDGPGKLLKGVDNLILYNSKVAANERFVGFQTDIELQDENGFKPSFHNAIGDSHLNKKSGGVWKSSQAADRAALVQDYLKTHDLLKAKLKPKGLLLGAAIPSWWDAYYGDPISATYKGKYQDIFRHLSGIVNEIHFMAYNTDPLNVKSRVDTKLQYLSKYTKVKACVGLETNSDVGETVSYGDTPGKNSKRALMRDISKLESLLKIFTAFKGICIHDFDGFLALRK